MNALVSNAANSPDGKRKANSVEIFIKRVYLTFATLLVLGVVFIFFLIYKPLNSALEKSLVENFSQISLVNFHSLQNNIKRGLEGAGSLSSRSMIKEAILEYNRGQMSLDELKDYTDPKFADGAAALEHLVFAQRYIGGEVVAQYEAQPGDGQRCFYSEIEGYFDPVSKLCISGGNVHFIVLSPVLQGKTLLAQDKLVFDWTEYMKALSGDRIRATLLKNSDLENLRQGAKTLQSAGKAAIFFKDEHFYKAISLQDDIYFVSVQSEKTLREPIHSLRVNIFFYAMALFFIFIYAVTYYVVAFARRELMNFENREVSLRRVALEAEIDVLTGAGSRRSASAFLGKAFAAFLKGAPPLGIAMIDIDSFKEINDAFGHAAGDRVLINVVETVMANLREEDRLFRWGGDEFILAFEGRSGDKALAFAGRILSAVSALCIDAGNGIIRPTVSIGISFFNDGDSESSAALNRADGAMYESKAKGKNQVSMG